MALELKSPAFTDKEYIPAKYTCQGEDISPPLIWTGAPAGVKSFALINDDPDAPSGDWVHWVIYDIPRDADGLPEGVPNTQNLPNGAKQSVNDGGDTGYGGPCPPPGKPHRYYFKLYALDIILNKPAGLSKTDLLKVMKGHILAEAQILGYYKR